MGVTGTSLCIKCIWKAVVSYDKNLHIQSKILTLPDYQFVLRHVYNAAAKKDSLLALQRSRL